MKISRRQALWSTLVFGAGATGFFGIKKIYRAYSNPDFSLLETNKQDVEALVDAIIPSTTDSPGAITTNTAAYVLNAVRKCTETKTQNNFIHGLKDCRDRAMSAYGKSLVDCSRDQHVELLTLLESESGSANSWKKKVERRLLGDDFIFTLKRLTVWGYCTSEVGATMGLSYDYIPAKFVGDVRLSPGQKSWATS